MNMSSGYDRTATLMNSQWVGCRHKIKAVSIPAWSEAGSEAAAFTDEL